MLRSVAALAGLFLVPAAQAAITVDFRVGTQNPLVCTEAENVRLTPAATVDATRFAFDCATDGVQRVCQPAVASQDPDILPGGPNVKYEPTGSGARVTVLCDDSSSAAPVSIKGTEVIGIAGADPLAGCHPATNVSFQLNVAANDCVANAGAGSAPCLRYQCPGDPQPRACFPVAELDYTARLPEADSALRRVDIVCELRPPMLRDDFDS